jgi:hypothetical protein
LKEGVVDGGLVTVAAIVVVPWEKPDPSSSQSVDFLKAIRHFKNRQYMKRVG